MLARCQLILQICYTIITAQYVIEMFDDDLINYCDITNL